VKAIPPFPVAVPEAEHTLAKVLRSRLHESLPSWAQVKALIEGRRVKVGNAVVTDPARRVHEGEVIELLAKPVPRPKGASAESLVIRHLDDHVVVVEKTAGMNTVRHPSELDWPERHRAIDPTLEDLTQWAIAKRLNRPAAALPRLRIVQRLDRDTSGLVVFARSADAERNLGRQFRRHTVVRRYLAVVPGILTPRTIKSRLVKDRGDGRRGSTTLPDVGKEAVTHVAVEERLKGYTLLSIRLETGKTHQIRIHLSEAGHPVCGDKVYFKLPNGEVKGDKSGAPRLVLHATELGFDHPVSGEAMHWEMKLPKDLQRFVERLKGTKSTKP
jgi:23S rRNA pseudouridine1911/1915/1917 synthase